MIYNKKLDKPIHRNNLIEDKKVAEGLKSSDLEFNFDGETSKSKLKSERIAYLDKISGIVR